MFIIIVRVLIISFLTYLVLNESGTHTAIVVYLILSMQEFIKWVIRDNHKYHLSEIKELSELIVVDQKYTTTQLKRSNVNFKRLEDRIEILELIIGPITGESVEGDDQAQEHKHPENNNSNTGHPL